MTSWTWVLKSTYIYSHIHRYIQTDRQTYTYIYIYILIYIYIYIHTHTYNDWHVLPLIPPWPCLWNQNRQVLPAGPSAETAPTTATTTPAAGLASPNPRTATRARRWDTRPKNDQEVLVGCYEALLLLSSKVSGFQQIGGLKVRHQELGFHQRECWFLRNKDVGLKSTQLGSYQQQIQFNHCVTWAEERNQFEVSLLFWGTYVEWMKDNCSMVSREHWME